MREVLDRPRTGQLAPILPTIQQDQYHLITWPATHPLVIQGGPGTGKTIVAAHRAAYLVNSARDKGQLRHVGLVGPTSRYEEHVKPVVRALTERSDATASGRAGTVHIVSIAGLLAQLAGIPPEWFPAQLQLSRIGSDWNLGRIAQRAAAALRSGGHLMHQQRQRQSIATLVNALAQGHPATAPLIADDPEVAEWFRSMGSFDRAQQDGQYLPFLAAAGLAIQGAPQNRFDHLVVDEAQDVTPLEWRILNAYLVPSGQFTIVGDMNQRRSDWSAATWAQLGRDLEISSDDGHVDVQELGIGYRTTREILRFADRLLPQGERSARSLRSGPPPEVRRHPKGGLIDATYVAASDLAHRHSGGLVAVICMQPRLVSDAFRRHRWTRPAMRDAWSRHNETVVILMPDQARGLEFDGVVVVEPASFPLNLGRSGQLYTSLTRAVHELVVLYSQGLPLGLRAR